LEFIYFIENKNKWQIDYALGKKLLEKLLKKGKIGITS